MSEAALLARWWSRPTADERDWWRGHWPGDAAEELQILADEADGDELLREYERLFVGPGRTACPPYESLWREEAAKLERGRLMGPAAADVASLYRALGLRVRGDAHELPDHLAIEWEALAFARERGAPEAGVLAARLAAWVPSFCRAVADEAEHPFYAALARLTAAWTSELAA